MRIRDGIIGDTPALVDMNAKMAMETEHKTLDRAVLERGVSRLLADRTLGRYFVAVDDPVPGVGAGASERVVGCLMITTEWSDWRDGHFWWIQSVYVVEDARRRGV